MRYVNHADRKTDYKVNHTTLWLLILLLLTSFLALLQISSMNSTDVFTLFAGNQAPIPIYTSDARMTPLSEELRDNHSTQIESRANEQIRWIAANGALNNSYLSQLYESLPDAPWHVTGEGSDSLSFDVIFFEQVSDSDLIVSLPNALIEEERSGSPLEPSKTEDVSRSEPAIPLSQTVQESLPSLPEAQSAAFAPPIAEPSDPQIIDAPESLLLTDPASSETTPKPQGAYLTEFEEEVIGLLNEKRSDMGLSQLTHDSNLAVSADIRAQEISVLFSHVRPDGSAWNTSGYGIARGENLAYGQADPATVIADWMASTTHQENMLNDMWSIVAVSCYEANGVVYWVQHFA